MKKHTLSIIIILLFATGLIHFQCRRNVGNLRQSVGLTFKSPQALLSEDMIQIIAGEFHGLLADYMLLEVGSFVGSNAKANASDYQNIYHALKQSLTLDPYFQQTYLLVQGILPWKPMLVDEAIELLNISRQHRPWDWRPGHYIGFDYYYFKNDFNKASEVLLETAEIKGSPVLLAILGARFAAKGQRTEAAIVMLKQMLKNGELSEPDRLEIEQRLVALSGVFVLEKAIARYRTKTSHYPSDLGILVHDGIISTIPPNPYADQYFYNSQTGSVAFDQIGPTTPPSHHAN